MNNQITDKNAIIKAVEVRKTLKKWMKMANNNNISYFKKAKIAWEIWECSESLLGTFADMYKDEFYEFSLNYDQEDDHNHLLDKELLF